MKTKRRDFLKMFCLISLGLCTAYPLYSQKSNTDQEWTFVSIPDFLNFDIEYPQQGWEDALGFIVESMKKENPAVVHVDGTARLQIVREQTNPAFYRILDEYKKITGGGTLLNTSFNSHEEPIVRTPAEAIATLRKARLDYLAIGNYLVPG